MLSRLSPRKLSIASITRIVLAGMLLLALLAGVVPLGALTSSAEQTCTMSCCVGKPPHIHGSCGAAFSDEQEADTQASPPEIIEAESHCGTPASHHSEQTEKASHAPRASTVVKAHVLTTPCSPECAAAATSASVQVRRARETAALAESQRPFAPACASLAERIYTLQKSSAAKGRRASPRGPPRSFS